MRDDTVTHHRPGAVCSIGILEVLEGLLVLRQIDAREDGGELVIVLVRQSSRSGHERTNDESALEFQ